MAMLVWHRTVRRFVPMRNWISHARYHSIRWLFSLCRSFTVRS